MGGIGKQLGIVLAALVASVGLVVIAAPDADAKTVDVDKWAKGCCTSIEDWETTTSKGARPHSDRHRRRGEHIREGEGENDPPEDR